MQANARNVVFCNTLLREFQRYFAHFTYSNFVIRSFSLFHDSLFWIFRKIYEPRVRQVIYERSPESRPRRVANVMDHLSVRMSKDLTDVWISSSPWQLNKSRELLPVDESVSEEIYKYICLFLTNAPEYKVHLRARKRDHTFAIIVSVIEFRDFTSCWNDRSAHRYNGRRYSHV